MALPTFNPNLPFAPVEGETLDILIAPRPRAPQVAAPAAPVFNPNLPFTPVPEASAATGAPKFDPNAPAIKVFGLDEFSAKPAEELIADKDFMPVQFGTQHETELTPEQRTKLEQVYAARETSGTSVKDKAKSFFTGISPAVKMLAEGVGSAAKLQEKLSLPGLAKRVIGAAVSPDITAQDVVNEYAKSGTEAAASVELAALGSTDLLRRSNRAVGEGFGVEPSDLVSAPALALRAVKGLAKSKADLTEGDWRTRLSDDIAAQRQVEAAGQGNGEVMRSLGIDAATLEQDFGIKVDPEEIAKLSVVTDPINYVPFGAAVGAVTKIGGKLVRVPLAAAKTAAQATEFAKILNAGTVAASEAATLGKAAIGGAAKVVGGAVEAAGNVAEKGVRALGGTASGVGLGGLLGGNVYSALGGAAIAKGVPRAVQIAGRTLKGAGRILTGEATTPAGLTLAADTLKAGAAGTLKGAAEAGALILPFEIGARPEEEEQLLGMVGLGAGIRGGIEGAAPGAKAAGRAAQNRLAETIFKTVEQTPLAESPTYGTDPLLDTSHAANVAKVSPAEQKLVAWGRELLRAAGGEVYVVDTPTFAREALGNKTARGYAVSIGETIAPDGSAKPLFRIFLNRDAEALPHEFFHALTSLDPKRAKEFQKVVKDSLTPEQLRSFEQLYNSALNNGLPEVQWKRRLTPEQVANEAAAETFSRIFLSQDLSGVAPNVRQKAALFVSSLLEKVGAPLVGVNQPRGKAGVSSLGVRPGTESVKTGQAWIADMLKRVNDEGTLGEPAIQSERPETQTPIPADVVKRKPATPPPVNPPLPTPPTAPPPVNPPLPTPPTGSKTRNIRTPKAKQNDFAGRRAEVTNIESARAAAAAGGDANTVARVDEISALIESGSPAIEIEHSGVRAAGNETAPSGRTARRAEQEAAYIAEGMGAAPESVREAYQKVFVPVRWETVGGKPQLLAMSLDKVIANAHKTVKEAAQRGVEAKIPYEIVDGKLTDNAWGQFVDDLSAYADNQANGYRGDGQKLTRPTEDVGLSIPAENPDYNPRPITEERANFLNMVQGLNPPLTARVGKQSSAVLPGNVKGQILAEVNARQPETPSVIRPEDITKQEFKNVPGRSVAETNPLRNELAAAGVPVRELIEVTERINAGDINSVRPRPELDFKAPVTDTIRGGFLPEIPDRDGRYWIDQSGRVLEVDYAHSDYGPEEALYRKGWIRVVAEKDQNGLLKIELNSATDRVKPNPKQAGVIDSAIAEGARVNDGFGTFGNFLPSEKHSLVPVLETDDGKTYPGKSHADAMARALADVKAGKITGDEFVKVADAMEADGQHKFLDTATGEVLDRAEAGKRTGAGHAIQSEELNRASVEENLAKLSAPKGDFMPSDEKALTGLAFKDFFSRASKGEFGKSEVPWVPLTDITAQKPLLDTVQKHSGNFDEHIAKSIPSYRETQLKKGSAILALAESSDEPVKVLDVGGSEGSWDKALSEQSGGKVQTLVVDPNPTMAEFFRTKSKVPGAEYSETAWVRGFEDEGKTVPAFTTEDKFDVVNESMVFQFISPEREAQVAEAKKFLKPDGLFITDEKVRTDAWATNEAKKDTDYKAVYFSKNELAAKDKVVGFQQSKSESKAVGMVDNMVPQAELEATLKKNFKHVAQYWDSGNFKGYAASDSLPKLDKFLESVGDTKTDFTTTELPRRVEGDFQPTAREYEERRATEKAAPKKATKAATATKLAPAMWILPDGEVRAVKTQYHEQDLAANRAEYNKKFGTDFSEVGDQTQDRLAALNNGFVRLRYAPENGRTTVEVGTAHWNKQKSKVLDTLIANADKVDTLKINLVDEDGVASDSASATIFNADNKGAAITDAVNEIIPPKLKRVKNLGPSDIQRIRSLPGEGDFMPSREIQDALKSDVVTTEERRKREGYGKLIGPEEAKQIDWTRGAGAEKSDFQSLLAETERTPTGELRKKPPQNELALGLGIDDIKKR